VFGLIAVATAYATTARLSKGLQAGPSSPALGAQPPSTA